MSDWVFVRRADGRFTLVGRRRFWDFLEEKAALPFAAPAPVLTAEFGLTYEGRRVVDIWQAHFCCYEVGADGRRDHSAVQAELATFTSLVQEAMARGEADLHNLSAKSRLLSRRIDTLYRWQPTEADLEALARAVNRRPGFPLLPPGALRLLP